MNLKLPGMAERIELWPVEKVLPYDKNPRTHSDEQVSQIAASIIQFGMVTPLLVDSQAGLIAGHGRLEAAKLIGLSKVPVVILDHLTEDQKRAYVIADNKLAENAGWDKNLLSQEIESLIANEFDIGLVGFSEDEISQLLSSMNDDLSDGFEEGEGSANDDVEEADTNCVIGSYRIPIQREDYMRWHDSIRAAVGFDKDAIKKEIRKRLKI